MDEDVEENTTATKEGEDEVQEVLLHEQQRNAELKKLLNHSLKENSDYKKRYHELQQQVSRFSELMKKNACLFYELFSDTKIALHMSTSTDNSTIQFPANDGMQDNSEEVLPRANPQPGPLGVTKNHNRVVNIGGLNLKESEQSFAAANNGQNLNLGSVSTSLGRNEYTRSLTVSKTTSTERAPAKAKDVHVQLNKLSLETVQKHPHKEEVADTSVDTLNPHFTSTPNDLKLETMKGLGLHPSASSSPNRVINIRETFKKEKKENSPSKRKSKNELKKLFTDTNEGKELAASINKLMNRRRLRSTKRKTISKNFLRG